MQTHIPLNKRAFTLIELLIVVAIIAILAAIAVPNFLEAQTRAKVSRVKADMRSIGTALESYAVDNNVYPSRTGTPLPPGVNGNTPGSGLGSWVPQSSDLSGASITTPIAYMSSVPTDVFNVNSPITGQVEGNHPVKSFRYFRVVDPPINPAVAAGSGGSDLDATTIFIPPSYSRRDRYGRWFMISFGPDADDDIPSFNFVYDPTNGTVSNGDVIYSQRNQFDDQI